jgi:hypothetical protein
MTGTLEPTVKVRIVAAMLARGLSERPSASAASAMADESGLRPAS